MSFKRNLQIGFGLSLLFLLISSVASYVSIQNLIGSAREVNHTDNVLRESQEIISFMKDAETGQRGYLLSGEKDFLEPYSGAMAKAIAALEKVRELTQDNPGQQTLCSELEGLINRRFNMLQQLIDEKKAGLATDVFKLKEGKNAMDSAREIVRKIQITENTLLAERTHRMNRFADYTPVLIIIAAALSFLITILFYKKVSDDYDEKAALNLTLYRKDEEIKNRLRIIERIAHDISKGDYKVRVNDKENDSLGSLSASLNEMAKSLDYSFGLISSNEWLQKGIAGLSEKLAGDKDTAAIAFDALDFICCYTASQAGVFYVVANGNWLRIKSSYAFKPIPGKEELMFGEGLAGQCALSKKQINLTGIDETDLLISFSGGEIKPKNIFVFPVFFEGSLIAVIELASLSPYNEREMLFFNEVSGRLGMAVNTAQNRAKLKELLEETQAQAEEMQAQHSELENLNTELEAQAEKLQVSEEELKVQQEELQEVNQELEERTRQLEEKNHLVVVRNLDIQKKAEELALSVKYKSEFLANMSHELRTPLNSILLLSRLLAENSDGNLKADQVEYASVIQSSGNGLLQLINEILDLSKIESGKMELDYEFLQPAVILENMRALFEPLAKEKNVALNLAIEPGVPADLQTDKMRLEQVLKNLLSNALKFTHKGYINLTVRPSATREGFVEFSVKDSGIGIAKDKQHLIFEAFQQADGSTKRKYGGTGLGLSISRQLAVLLGGDISLTSEPDKGSEFVFWLPFNRQVAVELSANRETQQPHTPPMEDIMATAEEKQIGPYTTDAIPEDVPDDRNNIQPGDKTILIVEDDTPFAKVLLDFTRQKGYKGIVTVRGDYAIDLARIYRPSGILLDIQLPVKDGLQVMDELKKDPVTKPIPVHTMSSFEARKESLVRGAVDFINKPIPLDQVENIFSRIEYVLKKESKKVIIVEENTRHARALAYFLSTYDVNSEISGSVEASVDLLKNKEVDCVILDMGIPDQKAYEALEAVKQNNDLENVPVIIFTGKSLSKTEELRIKQYADSIVVKTAHSYQRIKDEVSLFLHLVEEHKQKKDPGTKKLGSLDDVLQQKKVLIADDDVRNIFSMTKALERHKMQVLTAMDGKEVLQLMEQHPDINIILMDMMMPVLDGYEAIAEIRKSPAWKKLPIIAVTAKAMTGDREKCIQIGASDYISKPVDTDQLISLLRIWLYETGYVK
ncbi:response regulator [Foetidibacter luteolus]|uniref:response regulator n=1 Tax=Foetidibacter luteolus TaxID=2608880 RepID=UPI001A99E43A|nr:response regulator [Foetidibacter luteolus]